MDEQDRKTGNAKPSLAVVRLMGSGSIMFIFTLRPSAFIFTRKTLKIFGGRFFGGQCFHQVVPIVYRWTIQRFSLKIYLFS